jgi:hypothetical protein
LTRSITTSCVPARSVADAALELAVGGVLDVALAGDALGPESVRTSASIDVNPRSSQVSRRKRVLILMSPTPRVDRQVDWHLDTIERKTR